MKTYLVIFGKPRYLGLVKIENEIKNGSFIILKTMRGLEMGVLGGALSETQEEKYRNVGEVDGESHGTEPMLQEVVLVAVAGEGDAKAAKQNRKDEENILLRARELLVGQKLEIKLVEIEYLFDRKKLFFYFTAEHRVDFRAYVRDLAREFRTRIEMRQIGVRDEARTAKGLAQCGQPCCCSYWLHEFVPICIRMVKEQNLALNPTKISGLCGRLMCCMSYEHKIYEKLWKGLPGPGTKIKTPNGNYIIDGIDIKNEKVIIGFPHGAHVPIAISDFEKFRQTVSAGEEWELPEEERAKFPAARLKPIKEEEDIKEVRDMRETREKRTYSPTTKQEKISLEEHFAVVGEKKEQRKKGKKPAAPSKRGG